MDVYCMPLEPNAFDRPYTNPRRTSNYGVSWNNNIADLAAEAAKLGADEVVIAVDVSRAELRLDGFPKANTHVPPPVAIYIPGTEHNDLRFLSDRWDDWRDNVRAVGLTLQRLRLVAEAGVAATGEQYQGWQALPPGTPMPAAQMTVEGAARLLCDTTMETIGEDWRDVVDGRSSVRDLYREAIKTHHPDHGGDAEMFRRLTEARDLLLSS